MELAKGAFYHIHTPYSSPSQALPTARLLRPHISALYLFLVNISSFLSSSIPLNHFHHPIIFKSQTMSSVDRDWCERFFTFVSSHFPPPFTEAVDILKEMKEKEVLIDDTQVTVIFHILSSLAAKGNTATIQRLQETIFTLGLAKPTTNLCSPLISAYLDR